MIKNGQIGLKSDPKKPERNTPYSPQKHKAQHTARSPRMAKNDPMRFANRITISPSRTTIPTEKNPGNPKNMPVKTRQHLEMTRHKKRHPTPKRQPGHTGTDLADTHQRDNMVRPWEQTRQTTFCLSVKADSITPSLAKDPRWRPRILSFFIPTLPPTASPQEM